MTNAPGTTNTNNMANMTNMENMEGWKNMANVTNVPGSTHVTLALNVEHFSLRGAAAKYQTVI